ncbi:MAG TPA: dienelactone hydrolase family protein [Caulobacterales bacterium]|nr:dienelactone hydrolase family protein [Caulobacterales bacterium]
MIEKQADIQTPDGAMKTLIYHPEGKGPYPIVLYLMDAPSIRPALFDMAIRMGTSGYYVMMPFTYYRGSPYREFGASDEDMHARRDLMRTITKAGIVSDAKAMLAYAANDPAASKGKAGVIGFCMGGAQALAVAAGIPERIAAAAAIHGGGFVTEREDSPHRQFASTKAELYFGWADQDPGAPKEHIPIVQKAAEDAGLACTIDFMEGALHGFAPRGPRYHRAASERHWEKTLDMFRRTLT